MKNGLSYTTLDEQISLLKSKNLIIDNEAFAKNILSEYGYYNIINSYKSTFIKYNDQGEKIYKDGVSFEKLYSLFILDHELKNTIMAAMLDLEEHLRAATSEVLASSFGVDHHSYLKFENFRDRKKTKKQFTLSSILNTLNENLQSDKEPISYYRKKYDCVPPWIFI